MTVKHNGSTVSVAGDSRITPFGAVLRHYKLDELPGLWDVLKLRPGITGPVTLKYRLEDEMLEQFCEQVSKGVFPSEVFDGYKGQLPDFSKMPTQEVAVWYNDNVIYPDKVRLNCYYYRHYSFWKDIEMIFATVLGFKVKFAGKEV